MKHVRTLLFSFFLVRLYLVYLLENYILIGVIVIGSDQVMTTLSSLPNLYVGETERVVIAEAVAQAIMSRASAFSGLSSMLHRSPQGMMGHALCYCCCVSELPVIEQNNQDCNIELNTCPHNL